LGNARERCLELYDRYYSRPDYLHHLDRYRAEIAASVGPNAVVLDAGCGDAMPITREVATKVRYAVGVDLEQPRPSGARLSGARADVTRLPFRDGAFDVVFTLSVVEHLLDPERAFREFYRVLKPGGKLILQTPNRWDYVSVVAHLTPFWFHRKIAPTVLGRPAADVFPTHYRANTSGSLQRILGRSGFRAREPVRFNQYPAYLMFSPLLFRLGVAYERVTTRLGGLAWLRGWILVTGEKPS
jgi:SAM-dependent methyltransferase